MIELIKSNGKVFTVNPQHIVTVEEYSDKETVITLVEKNLCCERQCIRCKCKD